MATEKAYDIITMGRSSIDLYSNDIGAPFEDITSFAAYVGGCPLNISVGMQRLGSRAALLTAVGDDQVGSFILHFLQREGVETRFSVHKPGKRSSAVLMSIQPPDRFPLTFYRDNCADIELTIDDVLQTPIAESRVLLISGTGLSKEPSRSATLFAAEVAQRAGTTVALDIDFRPDQWHDARAFGVTIRAALRLVDIVLGTEDEINAAMLTDPSQVSLTHSQLSDARVSGDIEAAIQAVLALGPKVLLHKRGAAGCRVHLVTPGSPAHQIHAPGFPVEVSNILGAGDAFAAGALHGFIQGWDWYKAARLANACGAIVVTKPGCANFTPTYDEVMAFVAEHGGF
ncbi:MAG: 5-dehydro-2-deoxygluconokinase [Herpetosiphonaceae bacterium]|nr:5-dehydro-2-deoxygluconokinase [Herpetosiphonaceae bacterium]